RDVFNDRVPAPGGLQAARRHLSAAGFAKLQDWDVRRAGRDAEAAKARRTAEAELAAGRRALAEAVASDVLADSVQLLSGSFLSRSAARYSSLVGISGRLPRDLRKAEETLVSLAYRSALKPSPYGSLTTIALVGWEPRGTAWPVPARRCVRLNQT